MIKYNIRKLLISRELQPYVRRFFYTEAKVKAPFDQPFFPSGYIKVTHFTKGNSSISIPEKEVIREIIDEGPYFSGIIQGDNAYLHFLEDFYWVTMELKAGMPYYLFHLDMTNLVNTTTHFSNVSDIAYEFNKQAIASNNLEQVIQSYEDFIKKCATNKLPPIVYVDQAIELIESRNGNISITELMDAIKISVGKRQFIRNFKKVVGLSPKHWCRIRQIEYVNDLMMQNKDLTFIAHEAGFFDQSHFNHTFQEFIRQSPKDFLASDEPDIAKFLLRGVRDSV